VSKLGAGGFVAASAPEAVTSAKASAKVVLVNTVMSPVWVCCSHRPGVRSYHAGARSGG